MQAFRASILDFISDPYIDGEQAWRYFEDGLLLVENGKVIDCGDYSALKDKVDQADQLTDYRGYLIMPGFIDSHVHYPQTDIIASHGAQLLDWLERFTFPVEKRFNDADYALDTAQFFIRQLLQNGTTTALVYATIHPQSVDAIFQAASAYNLRLASGKVMMDRHAPAALTDDAQSSYDDSVALIKQWHHHERLHYVVTPRFAATSSEAQLHVAQQLVNEHPDVYLQSHVAENPAEVKWISELFPWSRSYLDVYDHYGLLGDRSVYAHCIYLDEEDRTCMAKSGTAVAFCPTSNLFLGSGLFDMQSTLDHELGITIGTDVGGGTSFSQIRTLHEAYKVCQMGGYNLSPFQSFYMITQGAAKALYMDDWIGNFTSGKEADFVVIDLAATELMQRRQACAESLEDKLFALIILGDDRNIYATHVLGKPVYQRGN